MLFSTLSPASQEAVLRMQAMYQSASHAEQNAFLECTGLMHRSQLPQPSGLQQPQQQQQVAADLVDSKGTNTLVLSPPRSISVDRPTNLIRNRANQALRLVSQDNTILSMCPGEPLWNVCGAPLCEEDIQAWFSSLDKEKVGRISKESFVAAYNNLEHFGLKSDRWLKEKLHGMNMAGEEYLSFAEFSLLCAHLTAR